MSVGFGHDSKRGKGAAYVDGYVQADLAALAEVLTQNNPDLVVQTLRRLVPTYKTPRDVDIHNA